MMLAKRDKADLKDLEKIIEEQSKELALRSKAIDALQRNFESLSEFCKSEKLRTQYLTHQVEELTKENERLALRLKEGDKPPSHSEDSGGAVVKGGDHLRAELDFLKERNTTLQKELKGKDAEIDKLEDSLRRINIERAKFSKESNTLKDKVCAKERTIKERDHEIVSLKASLLVLIFSPRRSNLLISPLSLSRRTSRSRMPSAMHSSQQRRRNSCPGR